MATVFITGGAGFLGSHVADACLARGHRVIIVDHHKKEKIRFVADAAEVYRWDFSDARVRQLLFETRPDVVFHFAAQISVTDSVLFPIEDARRNIVASLRFLEWCKEANVGKVIFASSGGAIYGDHAFRPTPLLHDAQPVSPYGIGKQAFEHYLYSAEVAHGLPWVSLRFSNIYGPRQQVARMSGEGNVLSLFLHRMLVTQEPLTIFGDGSSTRDYVYVRDAVSAALLAFEGTHRGAVHVSSGKEISLKEVVTELFRVHGNVHEVVYAPARKGEVYRSVLDPYSAHEVLAWKAATPFAEGVAETYAWFKNIFGR